MDGGSDQPLARCPMRCSTFAATVFGRVATATGTAISGALSSPALSCGGCLELAGLRQTAPLPRSATPGWPWCWPCWRARSQCRHSWWHAWPGRSGGIRPPRAPAVQGLVRAPRLPVAAGAVAAAARQAGRHISCRAHIHANVEAQQAASGGLKQPLGVGTLVHCQRGSGGSAGGTSVDIGSTVLGLLGAPIRLQNALGCVPQLSRGGNVC